METLWGTYFNWDIISRYILFSSEKVTHNRSIRNEVNGFIFWLSTKLKVYDSKFSNYQIFYFWSENLFIKLFNLNKSKSKDEIVFSKLN
jgi:hypothetical protein